MMIKMRPAVYANHRRKDGSYPVKIVVYFNGKERKLATHIVAEAKDLTRSLKLKQGEKYDHALELIRKMREACADIPYFDTVHRDVDFIVNHIKAKLAKVEFRLDFFEYAETYIAPLKDRTRAGYVTSLNAWERFIGKRECDINSITHAQVEAFMEFVENEPRMRWCNKTKAVVKSNKEKRSKAQAPRHVIKLGAIFNAAKRKYNDEDLDRILIPRSPFANHDVTTAPAEGQRPLPQDVVQKMIHAQTDDEYVRLGLDTAIVSFGLMGANFADLLEATPPKDGVWTYNRRKTRDARADKALMIVNVPECLAPYIYRLQGRKKGVWLGRLHEIDARYVARYVNIGLERWANSEKIEPFTLYALRKTWATLARRIGVEKSLVDECLAHVGDYALTDIYAERPWDKINEANAKVLALFKWED